MRQSVPVRKKRDEGNPSPSGRKRRKEEWKNGRNEIVMPDESFEVLRPLIVKAVCLMESCSFSYCFF
jgi:hypothetical protein